MGKKLVLATRKSPLALAQAGLVAAYLSERCGAQCELLKIVTTGDKQAEWSLEEKGGKGLFTKELESAIADWIDNWNDEPKPFVWHKTADEILDTLANYCARISDSGH